MRIVGIIPTRLESSRLPGKALKDVCGLPAIVHVYKRCCLAQALDDVFVATDSEIIRDCVEGHGGKVLMTGKHKNGSERIHEALKDVEHDIAINIQGDEILVYPNHIDAVARTMLSNPEVRFCMGVTPFNKVASPHDFKAVLDLKGDMLYCSREDIPSSAITGNNNRLKVVFLVGFRKDALEQFVHWEATPLELSEPNEFLRILQHGERIRTVMLENAKISLDTQTDLDEIRKVMASDAIVGKYMKR